MSSCFLVVFLALLPSFADEPELWIGYTQLQTNLPGGRHANVKTMRAYLSMADGSQKRELGASLVDGPDVWTQFVGWSPDGRDAILYRAWNDPENARWEEEHKTFRMEPNRWLLDSCLLDLKTERITNLTAVDRVSHYNGGLFYLPKGAGLGFTPLIAGVSKPYVMDLDGRRKRDVSGGPGGFAYGYSASPDGKRISYHENYQIYLANVDGSNKRKVETGQPFNFGPRWSPDGQWVLFVSGEHENCHPYVVRADGTGLKKLADRGGYTGSIAFLDVPDFHAGSSDTPIWSTDGRLIHYTAKVGPSVELFSVDLQGRQTRLTTSSQPTQHYHPEPSPDGRWLAYGKMRDGVRQLYVMRLSDQSERPVTHLKQGFAAMWPKWRPPGSY